MLLNCSEEIAIKHIHCSLDTRSYLIQRIITKTEKLCIKLQEQNDHLYHSTKEALESSEIDKVPLSKMTQDYWDINKVIRQLSDVLDNIMLQDESIKLCVTNIGCRK